MHATNSDLTAYMQIIAGEAEAAGVSVTGARMRRYTFAASHLANRVAVVRALNRAQAALRLSGRMCDCCECAGDLAARLIEGDGYRTIAELTGRSTLTAALR